MTSSLYAALLAVMFMALTILVIRTRRRFRVAVMDGGVDELKQRIRAHGNFAEYAPFFLVLLFMAEAGGLPAYGVHLLGCLFIAGRVSHAYSVIRVERYSGGRLTSHVKFRIIGMLCTLTALGVLALILLVQFATR